MRRRGEPLRLGNVFLHAGAADLLEKDSGEPARRPLLVPGEKRTQDLGRADWLRKRAEPGQDFADPRRLVFREPGSIPRNRQRGRDAPRDGFAVAELAVAPRRFERVAQGVTEVEQTPLSALLRIRRHDVRLD